MSAVVIIGVEAVLVYAGFIVVGLLSLSAV